MAPGSSSAGNKLRVVPHIKRPTVPLTRHTEKIILDIIAPSTEKGKTANLDLVVVLDTSASMHGRKLEDMKQAAKFVIRKIGTFDTLTFVPFSSDAGTPSATPPPTMSTSAKAHARHFVDALRSHHGTNIEAGLDAAVRILHGRRDKTGRAAGIFLMSDGEENKGHARHVDVSEYRVYTFGFGHKHDRHLLHDIARKSHGGTYHYTPHSTDRNRLLPGFAKILGKIRDVSALNVMVTLKPEAGVVIQGEKPGGDYRVINGPQGSITIDYGFLARHEKRRIIVDLLLPAVQSHMKQTVMTVECTYRLPKERESKDTHAIGMTRDRNARLTGHFGLQLHVEVARRHQADRMRKMKRLADAKKLDKAMDELAEAKNHLAKIEADCAAAAGQEEEDDDDDDDECAQQLDALARELEHLEELLDSHKVYSDHGSAYLLAAILSHDRQSFAARGQDDDVMIYTLPRMLKYARQADEFYRNPNAHI